MAVVRTDRQTQKLRKRSQNELVAARVIDIILDSSHPSFEELGSNDSIGTIFFNTIDSKRPFSDPKHAPTAKPLFSFIKNYPLINEIVLLTSTYDKSIYSSNLKTTYYLPSINIWNHPHHNALPTMRGLDTTSGISNDYNQSENGAIKREINDDGTNINLGKYFNEKINLKPLLPYEGDIILEGRFGNSIRFGSTNFSKSIPETTKNPWSISDTSQTGDPIIIIKNGQSENLDNKGWIHTVEDINDDFSSVYLTSNQQITNLQVASTNISSYEAEEEPVDSLDPIRFERLTTQEPSGQTELTTPSPQSLPNKEEPILSSPIEPSQEEDTSLEQVKEEDPDYNDSNQTENENRTENEEPDSTTITSDKAPEFDLNELMG